SGEASVAVKSCLPSFPPRRELFDNQPADVERGRGCRRRRVTNVDYALALQDQEIIDHRSIARHRLCAYTAFGGTQVLLAYLWRQPLKATDKAPLAEAPPHFADAGAPIFLRQPQEAGKCQCVDRVCKREIAFPIALAREGQNGIRSAFHARVNESR